MPFNEMEDDFEEDLDNFLSTDDDYWERKYELEQMGIEVDEDDEELYGY